MKKDYVPVELWNTNNPEINRAFRLVRRVSITSIKIDKKYFSWPNEVDPAFVDFLVGNFSADYLDPIFVNEDYFLLDGQHRLQAMKRLGFKYVDIVIVIEEELKAKPPKKKRVMRGFGFL